MGHSPRVKTGEAIRFARVCLITLDRHLTAVPNVQLILIAPVIKLVLEKNAEIPVLDPVVLMPYAL